MLEYLTPLSQVVSSIDKKHLALYPLAHHPEGCGIFLGVRTATWAAVFIARECTFPRGQCGKIDNMMGNMVPFEYSRILRVSLY